MMDNVEILKSAYQHFAEGNVEAVLAVFDPQIVWDECTGFPYVEGNGIFTGHNAIVEGVFAQIPQHYDNFSVEIDELFGTTKQVLSLRSDKIYFVSGNGNFNKRWHGTSPGGRSCTGVKTSFEAPQAGCENATCGVRLTCPGS